MYIYLLLILLALSVGHVDAATYYIDYASGSDANNGTSTSTPWKRAPGMVGYAGSYSHAAGDKFVFKGGVTWPGGCFPMAISTYGTTGNPDIYTGGQTESVPWGTGYPVFDAEAGLSTSQSIMRWSDGYLKYTTVNGLKLTRAGTSGALTPAYAIYCNGVGSETTISNNEIIPYAAHAITIHPNLTADISWVKIYGNKISHATNSIEMGAVNYSGSYRVLDFYIYENELFDASSELTNGDHGDGLHIFSVLGTPSRIVRNLYYYKNKNYGNWAGGDSATSNTAFVYLEHSVENLYIHNSVFTFSNTTSARADYLFSPGFIVADALLTGRIYNNTFDATKISTGTGSYGVGAGIAIDGTTIEIINNIVIKPFIGISSSGITNLTAHHNVIVPRSSGTAYAYIAPSWYSNLAAFQLRDCYGGVKCGANSSESAPQLVENGVDVSLSASDTVAKDTGYTLGAGYNFDQTGGTRPVGVAYDIGAYEYGSGAPAQTRRATGGGTILRNANIR